MMRNDLPIHGQGASASASEEAASRFMPEAIERLLQDSATGIAGLAGIERIDEAAWGFSFSDDSLLFADPMDESGRLMLTIPLGAVPPDNQLAVYETLLSFNLLWPDTDGARIGLAGPNGEAQLLYEFKPGWPIGGASAVDAFQRAVGALRKMARAWRDYIESKPARLQAKLTEDLSTQLA